MLDTANYHNIILQEAPSLFASAIKTSEKTLQDSFISAMIKDASDRYDISFEDEYNIYILFFYEDQDGNVYDTENKINLTFNPTTIENERVRAHLRTLSTNNFYNAYSNSQALELIDLLKGYNHPLWKYFTIKE